MILIGRGLDLEKRGSREQGVGSRRTDGSESGRPGSETKPRSRNQRNVRENVEGVTEAVLVRRVRELRPVRF